VTRPDERPEVEREQTDASLRTEREKTDRALAERQTAVEEDADAVILHARQTADAVLVEAREKADEQLEGAAVPTAAQRALDGERAREDAAVKAERATADANLERERVESNLALARLLPLERVKTDRYLLTERIRSDDALSNRDDFLGIVSHDLRNLLGGIVMSAGILAKTADAHEQGKQILAGTARIQRYAARMNRLIGDLQDVASIDAGRMAVSPATLDVGALIAEAAETFQTDAVASRVSLETRVRCPAMARFDHDRLLQVLANLIANAIKFTAPGGRVTVEAAAAAAGDHVRVSVSDTGAGIGPEMREAVFERFWQAKDGDRRGLGLGLYISKSIVEAHGGRIWVESTVGAGSTFHFTVPVEAAPAPSDAARTKM
jgi:signal transduction histidine kinase